MTKIKLGKYKHFKGGLYEVIGIARHSETLEEMVVYKNLYQHKIYGRNKLWARPLKMFLEKVKFNNKKIPRFKFVREK